MIVVNRAIRIEKISYKLDQCGFSSAKSVMKKISSIRLETNIRLQKVTKNVQLFQSKWIQTQRIKRKLLTSYFGTKLVLLEANNSLVQLDDVFLVFSDVD